MMKAEIRLHDWGMYDGCIQVLNDKYPEPDPPTINEIFKDFLDKTLVVTKTDKQITFLVVDEL